MKKISILEWQRFEIISKLRWNQKVLALKKDIKTFKVISVSFEMASIKYE
tara:strand:+ start:1157 stop:1306 length:150 start_codon:yes stop_codon:yes gene_type:complete